MRCDQDGCDRKMMFGTEHQVHDDDCTGDGCRCDRWVCAEHCPECAP